eukprot:gnl/TRDRNA2_/TRDRNA2_184837_c0_seq1.p1 gnl/TRDRNA2_/TRDRNA2_184837_c0~~gnl/TRDRNA2_/TRDRNA2_184837_c0_seq1.p1  ORF type:complete len:330 (-),score=44.85 gnl/TRDRNA2_/TRDRNA2_184837_c0_seq1:128-1117(-)
MPILPASYSFTNTAVSPYSYSSPTYSSPKASYSYAAPRSYVSPVSTYGAPRSSYSFSAPTSYGTTYGAPRTSYSYTAPPVHSYSTGLSSSYIAPVSTSASPVKLIYFPVLAKGIAPALALEFAGMQWEAEFPDDWPTLKPNTPFGELPVLDVPGFGMVGHEIAILNFIGRRKPAIAGLTEKDFLISQQCMQEGEDIYKRLGTYQDTIMVKDKCTPEEYEELWSAADPTVHNRKQGVHVHLLRLQQLQVDVAGQEGADAGMFTSTGETLGELKLWTSLHFLVLIKPDILEGYPTLAVFYDRIGSDARTQAILETGGKFPGPFKQYFIPRE